MLLEGIIRVKVKVIVPKTIKMVSGDQFELELKLVVKLYGWLAYMKTLLGIRFGGGGQSVKVKFIVTKK